MEDAFWPSAVPFARVPFARTLPNSRHPNNEQYGGERLSPRHPFRLWDARTTGSHVQRAAKHPIHAFATCVRQHTTTSEFELRTCKQSMHALSPRALAAAQASDHASVLVPAPTAAARRPICTICPRAQTRHRHAMRAGGVAQHCKGGCSIHLPGPRAPEATPGTISCPLGLHFAPLAQICAKQGERAAVESRASSRAHLWACPAISIARPKDSGLY
jgi:hypothetical protein